MINRVENKKNKINKYPKLFILTYFMILGLSSAFAQVGMIGNNPDKSAVLDLDNANKGLLLPRISLISLTDKSSINGGNPAISLMVFNTNSALTGGTGFYYWEGSIWKKQIAADEIQGDNLGNHTAEQNLNMSSKNIDAVNIITTVNANVTEKTTTQTAQITKGTDNSPPLPGYLATAADNDGNIIWTPVNKVGVVVPKLMGVVLNVNTNATNFYSGNIWFDTKSYDPENAITLGTSTAAYFKYVVQKKGLHQIYYNYGNQRSSVANGSWYIRILKNGVVIAASDNAAIGSAAGNACLFVVDEFNVGDVISVDKGGNHYGWWTNLTKVSIFRFE
ncbi:hypothetical protein GKZ90_0024610 [Flavobacterium sp. MC2016-06]|jgi:hypothetical protein|uniref:hypothetical protein n=1 Tax=Flavobacterium sp. MC2016-06 TaxID=2676308 RepID=UPI0012BAB5A8|nr:hypothetical protein [Flavobacterium sp. MC2016-06]MBU3862083.1 hypothetical protein [Flavobacterium sp. MC2016-06]